MEKWVQTTMNKGLRLAGALLAMSIFTGALVELYANRLGLFTWLGRFSLLFWVTVAALAALDVIFLAGVLLWLWRPLSYNNSQKLLIRRLPGAKWIRWLIAIAIPLIPAFLLLFSPLGDILSGPYFRSIFWLCSGLAAAFCITKQESGRITPAAFALGLLLSATIHYFLIELSMVVNYPFLLIWSEGNRFYDYSVYLGSKRYIYPGHLTVPYYAPGRYLLWGLLFALPNTPIWLHRLWDAILWTLPYLLLGFLLARWSRLDRIGKWGFALWVVLFLAQGPVYATIVLSAVLVAALVRPERIFLSLVGTAIAGYYASLSRFTWLPAPATWSVFIWLSNFKLEEGGKFFQVIRRLLPIGVIALVGLLAGALANPTLLQPVEYSGKGLAFNQPLLWYRLFPNPTYAPGILLGLAIATGPLILFLAWSVIRKYWKLNWLQILGYASASLIFLAMGVIASVKIGGGSNLHNLDMFLISLTILTALAIKGQNQLNIKIMPKWAHALLTLALALPAWSMILQGKPISLPDQKVVDQALQTVSSRAARAHKRGEVLFIDHRQLLTFGYIKDIPLVSEYEKKYMMDQAMAGNADYFTEFYRDLAQQRFALIISQPLFDKEQDASKSFWEENNSWVKWVAKPLLCYYAPVETISEVQLQMLAPRANVKNCPP